LLITRKWLVITLQNAYILTEVSIHLLRLKRKKEIEMNMRLCFLFLGLIFLSHSTQAMSIIVDPDDFPEGTILNHVSKYATLSTSDGQDVYASKLSNHAADDNNTLEIGKQVFGTLAANEWYLAPSLQITFKTKVTHFSILVAELYPDAGPGSDPIEGMVYDEFDNLLSYLAPIESTRVNLGEIEPGIPEHGYWAYWKIEYSAPSIGKIILGGDSEPTTFDRLEFDCTETTVPEPAPILLLLAGLFFIALNHNCREKKLAHSMCA
jgi:hypothetical protein